MPKKEAMAMLNALIENEVDARAAKGKRRMDLSKNRAQAHYREYLPKKEITQATKTLCHQVNSY